MQTFFRSSRALSLLTLFTVGCGSREPAETALLARGAAARLRPGVTGISLPTAPARDAVALSRALGAPPGVLHTPPETTPPADPPTPTDCHDGLAVVVPSSDWLRVLSFAGGYDSWAATYESTDASGEEGTYFVAFDAQGRPFEAPRPVPAGTRVASFRYEFLLVGASVTEPFLAVLDARGREESRVTDPAIWGTELEPETRVVEVFAAPSRCVYEARVLVGSESGRSLLAVHRGSAGELVTERILDLEPVPVGSSSVLGVSPTEVLELVTPEWPGSTPLARVYGPSTDGWTLRREVQTWADGTHRPVAAARTWSGWSVLGTASSPGVPSELVQLADDGTTSAPIAVADYERCGSGLGSIASSGETTLFAIGRRIGGLHYGTLTAGEDALLPSSLVAHQGSGELAAVGVGPEGVSVRCYRADALRAPAP
ncbi:MAG: hypothetical protein ACK6CU_04280 [Deltaproteobacteria bacterium]